jgi:asparagine synthase (glutamine-hydrolysing)
MCGICGIVNLEGEHTVNVPLIEQMMVTQRHRGPDDQGVFCEDGGGAVGLGFCRLAILDLTPAGHQPMTNEDGTIWLVFNGEIYNFRELVPALEQAGHRFRSRSDSEVIIHAYEQWGADCLQRFNGMFAFAIWDTRRRSIFIARDRLGVKPLYYWSDGTHFAFSSELKALLTIPWLSRSLNMQALQSYLVYEYVSAPESIFTGIQKLPAAHTLELRLDGSLRGCVTSALATRQYWDVQFGLQQTQRRTVHDYVEEFRELLKAAVARRLISDVPLGVFLSGGLDSSSIVAMMSLVSNERPKTFSIGFTEKTFSELDYAQIVAKHYDTDHHVEILKPDSNALIHTITDFFDEPFADASALPTYLVSQTARKHVTVALGGDAGDEILAGYDWYRAHKIAAGSIDLLPDDLRNQLRMQAQRIPPTEQKKGTLNVLRRFLDGATLPRAMQQTRWQTFWNDEDLSQLLVGVEVQGKQALDARWLTLFACSGSSKPLDQQQYADIKRYLPDDILCKVDRMSMAVSLETRGPFLDYTLVEFAALLPVDLRLRGLSGKYLLKRAMQGLLPEQILHRQKLGFNIPYKIWLRHELRELLLDALAPARLQQQGLFRPSYVQTLVHEHLEGIRDHAHKLWQLLIFQLWAERYLFGGTRQIGDALPRGQITSSL